MSDFWDVYPTTVDGQPAVIRIDLGVADELEPREYPFCIGVCVLFAEADSAGMPTRSESTVLNELESVLQRSMKRRYKAVPVAVVTLPKRRDFVYYSPQDVAPSRDRLGSFVTSKSRRECEIFVLEDARWDFYRDALYPGPEDMLWMQDRQLVEELASEGDAIDLAREVDHFVVFKDTRQRKKFVTQAVRIGYTVGELTDDDADEVDPSYEVRLVGTHPVTLEAVSPITRELARLAWKFRGDYDGWGCMSMLKQSPKKKPAK